MSFSADWQGLQKAFVSRRRHANGLRPPLEPRVRDDSKCVATRAVRVVRPRLLHHIQRPFRRRTKVGSKLAHRQRLRLASRFR